MKKNGVKTVMSDLKMIENMSDERIETFRESVSKGFFDRVAIKRRERFICVTFSSFVVFLAEQPEFSPGPGSSNELGSLR